MAFTRADMMAAVERSPLAAGAHDRAGWVGLFTPDGRIEDPVGSRPHRGHGQIDRFYSTFIGPRDITFHRDLDVVTATTVIRDLQLEVAMGPSVTMLIPAYLRYDLESAGDELKIVRLQAFWELPTMVGQFLRAGARAVPAGIQLAGALLRNQGLSGTAGFLGGFRGRGKPARRLFAQFLDDARGGDEVAVRRRLARGAQFTVGDGEPIGTSELLSRFAGAHWRKLIIAGNHAAVSVEHDGRRAVLIADVDPKPCAITRVRYFSEPGASPGEPGG